VQNATTNEAVTAIGRRENIYPVEFEGSIVGPYLISHRRFIVLQDAGPEMKQVTKCNFSLFPIHFYHLYAATCRL
jgi:hypothetical protein